MLRLSGSFRKSSCRILAAPSVSKQYIDRKNSLNVRPIHSSPRLFIPTITTNRCPSCSAPLPTSLPACPVCSFISPLSPTITFHHIFGLPDHPNPFLVDIPTLKRRFREAQAVCHPDSWASKSPHKQDIAHTLSARINEAYQSLLNPLSRVEYILERNNHPISENEPLEEMEFITEVMQEREKIDDAQGPEQLDSIIEQNDCMAKIRQTVDAIADFVEKRDWESAKAAAIRLKYYESIDRAGKASMESSR